MFAYLECGVLKNLSSQKEFSLPKCIIDNWEKVFQQFQNIQSNGLTSDNQICCLRISEDFALPKTNNYYAVTLEVYDSVRNKIEKIMIKKVEIRNASPNFLEFMIYPFMGRDISPIKIEEKPIEQ